MGMSGEDPYSNGKAFTCPLSYGGEWGFHKERTEKAVNQIDEMHRTTNDILEYTKHLEKLDALVEIKDSLLSYVVGRNSVDTKTVNEIFLQQHKTFRTTQIVTGIVVIGLIGVIVFLLTGEHMGWIHELFSKK